MTMIHVHVSAAGAGHTLVSSVLSKSHRLYVGRDAMAHVVYVHTTGITCTCSRAMIACPTSRTTWAARVVLLRARAIIFIYQY